MAGGNPLGDGDTDGDGFNDSLEILAGTDVTDADSPGAPNGMDPISFAIAFNASTGPGREAEFGELVYAGAPGVEQRNWNRTRSPCGCVGG